MTSWKEAIGDFVVYLQAARRSPGTIRLYRYRIVDLAERFDRPDDITTRDLLAYLARPDLAPETVKSIRTAIRVFFRWAHDHDVLPSDPAARLPPIKVASGKPRPAPDPVIAAALAVAPDRERFMILLAAYAGLRAGEIARVHGNDFDSSRTTLTVLGKGAKTRLVPILHPELVHRLDELDGWAFPNRWNLEEPLTSGHVSKLLSAVLPDGWTAHTLRHRLATSAYAGSRDLLAVGELLGHSRPETTQRYVRLPDDALRAAVESALAGVEHNGQPAAAIIAWRAAEPQERVRAEAPCPSWCSDEAGHPWDVDVVDDHGALGRCHDHTFLDTDGRNGAGVVAFATSHDGGHTEKVGQPVVVVWLDGSMEGEFDAGQARRLAADLLNAADLLDEITG